MNKIRNGADSQILNSMWENQKSIETGNKNILVVADTSGSMTCYGAVPYDSAVGLAIYTAERNKGVFKDKFITFSENPILQEVKGKDIVDKYKNIRPLYSALAKYGLEAFSIEEIEEVDDDYLGEREIYWI